MMFIIFKNAHKNYEGDPEYIDMIMQQARSKFIVLKE